MTENPYDAPSSVVVPTENVEKPLRKRATWRILLFVMFLPTLVLALFAIRSPANANRNLTASQKASLVNPFEIRLWLNPIATPIAGWAYDSAPVNRAPGVILTLSVIRATGAFLLCGFVEWFFYGWLLDTWSYRRRLARSLESKQLPVSSPV